MHALTLESILWSVWPFFHGIDKGGCIPSNGCMVASHHTKVGQSNHNIHAISVDIPWSSSRDSDHRLSKHAYA